MEIDFYKRMNVVCKAIPYGRAASYGQVAMLCGKPNCSRQVGRALKLGLCGDVPAHRIVNSKGYLTGAGAFETEDTQKDLLLSEGIEVIDGERINLKIYGWKTEVPEINYFRNIFSKNNI